MMKIIKVKRKPIIFETFQFDMDEAKKIATEHMKKNLKHSYREGIDCLFEVNINKVPFKVSFDGLSFNLFEIETLEGLHIISDKDWIMTGVEGEHYACKPNILKKTYDIIK